MPASKLAVSPDTNTIWGAGFVIVGCGPGGCQRTWERCDVGVNSSFSCFNFPFLSFRDHSGENIRDGPDRHVRPCSVVQFSETPPAAFTEHCCHLYCLILLFQIRLWKGLYDVDAEHAWQDFGGGGKVGASELI